jgi:glucose/mannose-6-phosphate isomerase
VLGPREIRTVDKQGLWEAYARWPSAVRMSLTQPLSLPKRRDFDSVILAGMGGSGSACDILAEWSRPTMKVPVTVVKEYHLPGFAGPRTLVVVVSLSGDTKETLSILGEAVDKGCAVASVSSGGAMERTSGEFRVPFNRVEKLLVARASTPGMVLVPGRILAALGLLDGKAEFGTVEGAVRRTLARSLPSVSFGGNPSKKLAKTLFGRTAVVYASPGASSAAVHFKNSVNENAKLPVQVEAYPELFHNGIETWKASSNRAVVLLRGPREGDQVKEKVVSLRRMLKEVGVPISEFRPEGGELATLLSWCLALDLASVYLAVLKKEDPTPTPILSRMRRS